MSELTITPIEIKGKSRRPRLDPVGHVVQYDQGTDLNKLCSQCRPADEGQTPGRRYCQDPITFIDFDTVGAAHVIRHGGRGGSSSTCYHPGTLQTNDLRGPSVLRREDPLTRQLFNPYDIRNVRNETVKNIADTAGTRGLTSETVAFLRSAQDVSQACFSFDGSMFAYIEKNAAVRLRHGAMTISFYAERVGAFRSDLQPDLSTSSGSERYSFHHICFSPDARFLLICRTVLGADWNSTGDVLVFRLGTILNASLAQPSTGFPAACVLRHDAISTRELYVEDAAFQGAKVLVACVDANLYVWTLGGREQSRISHDHSLVTVKPMQTETRFAATQDRRNLIYLCDVDAGTILRIVLVFSGVQKALLSQAIFRTNTCYVTVYLPSDFCILKMWDAERGVAVEDNRTLLLLVPAGFGLMSGELLNNPSSTTNEYRIMLRFVNDKIQMWHLKDGDTTLADEYAETFLGAVVFFATRPSGRLDFVRLDEDGPSVVSSLNRRYKTPELFRFVHAFSGDGSRFLATQSCTLRLFTFRESLAANMDLE